LGFIADFDFSMVERGLLLFLEVFFNAIECDVA
jgi:hypothetical protein